MSAEKGRFVNRPYEDSDRRPSRGSIRLRDYDYSQAGCYFITVCTLNRVCLLGEIANGQMSLNEFGKIVQSTWASLPQSCETIELDSFVVMPNHIHGVVVIPGFVGAIHESPVLSARIEDRRRMALSKVVGRFKMAAAKTINGLRQTPGISVWQRNYYEHIIRDEGSLNRIRQYIAENPARWEFDQENPAVAGMVTGRKGDS